MMKSYLRPSVLIIMLAMTPCCAAAVLPDPTKPPDYVVGHVVAWDIRQIVLSQDRKLAVINGKIMHIGDVIDDVKVIGIYENSVELQGPNGKITLVLLTYPAKPIN